MEIIPLGPGFAAELRGVALADIAADDDAYRKVRAAFEEHSVLLFRDQEVTDDVQIAFSRRFGPLEITLAAAEGAGTNLVILTTIDKNGKVVPADHRLALRNKANRSSIASRNSSPGTNMRTRAPRLRPISSAPRNARRCRRNAGAWCGRIRRTAAARFTSLPMPTRSKAWSSPQHRSSLLN